MRFTLKPGDWFSIYDLEDVPEPEPHALRDELDNLVRLIDLLPELEREVIRMLWFEPFHDNRAGVGALERPGVPVSEAARRLGMTRLRVRTLERRAMESLRQMMEGTDAVA